MSNKEQRFKDIISQNSGKILSICKYYSQNTADANDIYQEILINIWKSLDNFRGDSAISTWIYRIAVNTSLTFTGKLLKQSKLFVNNNELLSKVILTDQGVENAIEKEHQIDALNIAITQLSVIDQSLITLMLEGLSMREIADVIGITEPNVKVKIHRIKEFLKQQLTNYNYGN